MSGSVESVVATAVGLKNYNLMQQKNASMLHKVLDNQQSTISDLMSSIPSVNTQLASGGTVGTVLHTTA